MGTRRGLTRDIGVSGLDHTWGQIDEDFLHEWRGQQKAKRVKEMLYNSPVIAAQRMTIEMPVLDIDWQVVSDEGDDDPRRDLVERAIENMSHSWSDHVKEVILAVFYGYDVFTITYQKVGSELLWNKFKLLMHDSIMRWEIDEDGGIQGVYQWPHEWPDLIPIERMLLYRIRRTGNNPEGESILRPAWIPYYYAKNLQQIEAIALERMGAGLPVVQPPMGADMGAGTTDREAAEKLVRNVRMDEQAGVVLPVPTGEGDHQKWHFTLLASGATVPNYGEVISRHEKRMLMAALAQFLMLGMDNVGALATFEGGTSFFTKAVNAIADAIADVVNNHAIPRLLRLNGYDPDGVRMEHSPAGDIDVAMIGQVLAQSTDKLNWLPEDEVWLRSLLRMPEVDLELLQQKHEEREQERQENRNAMMQGMNQRNQQGPPQPDQNAAEMYVADKNPYDDELVRFERRWEKLAKEYFNGQERRVLRGVRKMPR